MEEIERIADFEFEGIDMTESIFDKELTETDDLGFTSEDVFDNENSESVQAYGYDRTFVAQGPVVKVYKRAETGNEECDERLEFDMNLPVLKNEEG